MSSRADGSCGTPKSRHLHSHRLGGRVKGVGSSSDPLGGRSVALAADETAYRSQLSDFIRAGKYPVGLQDGEAFSADNYFPDAVLGGIEDPLPVLEARRPRVRPQRDQ